MNKLLEEDIWTYTRIYTGQTLDDKQMLESEMQRNVWKKQSQGAKVTRDLKWAWKNETIHVVEVEEENAMGVGGEACTMRPYSSHRGRVQQYQKSKEGQALTRGQKSDLMSLNPQYS